MLRTVDVGIPHLCREEWSTPFSLNAAPGRQVPAAGAGAGSLHTSCGGPGCRRRHTPELNRCPIHSTLSSSSVLNTDTGIESQSANEEEVMKCDTQLQR